MRDYRNYGDANVLEWGRLIDWDNTNDEVVTLIAINPYSDVEDKYRVAYLTVDTTDTWIDEDAVCNFAGLDIDAADTIDYALAIIDYYSWDNFGYTEDMDKAEVYRFLNDMEVALDGDYCPWIDGEEEV